LPDQCMRKVMAKDMMKVTTIVLLIWEIEE